MRTYLTDPARLAAHRELARQCFDKFRMVHCVAAYEALFAQVQPASAAGML
jgi:hypothetical protein